MDQQLRVRDAVPNGFVVDCATVDATQVTFVLRSVACRVRCPLCGSTTDYVHSRYRRRAADLPLGGRSVVLDVVVRWFRCESLSGPRKIFAERFGDAVLAPHARRTGRLDFLVRHLGLVLGGRPAARFARRLSIAVSNDTLIRSVRRGRVTRDVAPEIIGIDDFAFRRNCRYGTIIVDLKERRPLRLLPDREPATATAWLAAHTSISTVTRDRANAYGEAISRALPHALQVADRWHLMENASSAFLEAVRGSMKQIRSALSCRPIDPKLLTAAERLQYEGWLGRRAANDAVLALSQAGVPLKAISRRTGVSRGTVRRILRGERNDVFRTRQSSLRGGAPVEDTSGWPTWFPSQIRLGCRRPSPGAPIEVDARTIVVRLPDTLSAEDFDERFDRAVMVACLEDWILSEAGQAYGKLMDLDLARFQRYTAYPGGGTGRLSPAREICCFSVFDDVDRLLEIAERILLAHYGLLSSETGSISD